MLNQQNNNYLRATWIRIVILIIVGIPVFTGWPLNKNIRIMMELFLTTEKIAAIFTWTIYACIIWLVVYLIAGGKRLLEYWAVGFILGLTTSLLGAIMRRAVPILAGNQSGEEVSFRMIKLFIVIITVVPYSLLFVNSFSAKSIIEKIARVEGKFRGVGLHMALALRVFQHTGEVIFGLLEIWSENNPQKLIPRHRRDWGENWYSISNVFPWIWSAVFAWIFACIIQTFEPIPAIVDEITKFNKMNSKGG